MCPLHSGNWQQLIVRHREIMSMGKTGRAFFCTVYAQLMRGLHLICAGCIQASALRCDCGWPHTSQKARCVTRKIADAARRVYLTPACRPVLECGAPEEHGGQWVAWNRVEKRWNHSFPASGPRCAPTPGTRQLPQGRNLWWVFVFTYTRLH